MNEKAVVVVVKRNEKQEKLNEENKKGAGGMRMAEGRRCGGMEDE